MGEPAATRDGQYLLFGDPQAAPTLRDIADAVREAGIAGLPSAVARANASYQEVDVRSALASASGMPFRWTLNPYRGCTHACEYCYARKYQRHLELGSGDDFSSVILVKRNLPHVLQRELQRRTWAHETVAIGTATDPYQPIEGHYRLTRRCLEILAAGETPFSIVTKGPLVIRDADVLTRAGARAGCQVYMSVPSVDEHAWTTLEPGTAPPSQRLRAIRQLGDAGVPVGVLMMPLVPGISTSRSSIERTVAAIAEAGVPLIGSCVARFDPGAREHFLQFLEQTFPDLLERYRRLYAGAHAAPDYVNAVRRVVSDAAGKAGLDRTGARDCISRGTQRSAREGP